MFCSGCGQTLQGGQPVCAQCGRPVAPAVPPIPGFEYQLASYSSKVRTLGILWFVYAGVSILFGIAGLSFAKHFFEGGFGPFSHGQMPPDWFFPMAFHFVWLALVLRAVLCVVAGWGLLEHTQWGKVMAIVAAVLSLIKVPFGTALGIATLVILLGYRNSALYDQLSGPSVLSDFRH
jgi:hypothetical protein